MGSRLTALFMCILLALQVFAGVSVSADTLPRHLDPQTLGSQLPDVGSLNNLYGLMFNRIALGDFSGAISWLDLAKLVYTPSSAEYQIARYNGQLDAYIHALNVTKADLEIAKEYLRHMKTDELEAQLQLVMRDLKAANITLQDIHSTSLDVATLLNMSPIKLLDGENKLGNVTKGYSLQVENIQQVIQANPLFNKTHVSLDVVPSLAFVGSKLEVNGALSDEVGNKLGVKSIDVLFDGNVVGHTVTDSSGRFRVELMVPFVYDDYLNVTAEYWPVAGDQMVYLPSSSNEVQVKLIYYTPVIHVAVPNAVYPGKVFPIIGNITCGGVLLSGISVKVAVFRSVLMGTSGIDGRFSVETLVPSDSHENSSSIRFISVENGVYASATTAVNVTVVRLPLELVIDSPAWAVSGFPVKISGRALSGGAPVVNSSIIVESGVGSIVTRTGDDGEFEANLIPSLVLGTETYPFVVKATPVEPWIRPSSVRVEVFMTNLITLVGGPVLLVAGGFYVSRNIRRRPRGRPEYREEPRVEEPIPVAVVPVAGVEPEGMRGSYVYALGMVSTRTGVIPRPSSTLREYLSYVWDSLGEVGQPFRALTMMYERWLYGKTSDLNLGVVHGLLRLVREFLSREG